jgi:hypothetical protein
MRLSTSTGSTGKIYLMSTHPHQCPHCELAFLDSWEVQDHISADHPEHAVVDSDEDEDASG